MRGLDTCRALLNRFYLGAVFGLKYRCEKTRKCGRFLGPQAGRFSFLRSRVSFDRREVYVCFVHFAPKACSRKSEPGGRGSPGSGYGTCNLRTASSRSSSLLHATASPQPHQCDHPACQSSATRPRANWRTSMKRRTPLVSDGAPGFWRDAFGCQFIWYCV